jgi:hypothetical protein
MAAELAPVDIRQVPGLASLVDEVQQTRRSLRILRDEEVVAILKPGPAKRPHVPRTRTAGPSITEQTAGIFKQYRLKQPLTPCEEREAFEQGVADEVAKDLGG